MRSLTTCTCALQTTNWVFKVPMCSELPDIYVMSSKVNNRELKEVDHFKYLGSVLTRDGYCTRKTKMRIAIAKEAVNRKMSLLTSNLNIELKKKLVRCYVWSIVLYSSETWALRKLERKYIYIYIYIYIYLFIYLFIGEVKICK